MPAIFQVILYGWPIVLVLTIASFFRGDYFDEIVTRWARNTSGMPTSSDVEWRTKMNRKSDFWFSLAKIGGTLLVLPIVGGIISLRSNSQLLWLGVPAVLAVLALIYWGRQAWQAARSAS